MKRLAAVITLGLALGFSSFSSADDFMNLYTKPVAKSNVGNEILLTSFAYAQGPGREITVYDPADALYPFKLISLAIRPPIAILDIFVEGIYLILDSEPLRRAFDIDYQPGISIDEDY